jgi:glutathione S-transferase
MVLYTDEFFTSPYAFSVFVTLREKRLPFQLRTVALQRHEQHADDFRRLSLTGRVPALEDGTFTVSESSAIVEYLDERYPDTTPALPRDVRERARARQLMAWIRSDLLPIREERATHTIFYRPAERPLSASGEAAAGRLMFVASRLVPPTAGPLFGAFSTVDADLALMLMRLRASGRDLGVQLTRYTDTVWSRPSVAEWVAHERPPYEPY